MRAIKIEFAISIMAVTRYRKHPGLPRFAVTGKPLDLHNRCPIWWLP
jgi:hypothetical protein